MTEAEQQALMEEIKAVLMACKGIWMMSYQILAALPETRRAQLVAVYGESGQGNGPYSAANYVSQVAAKVVRDCINIDQAMLSTVNLMVCPDPNWMNRPSAQAFVFPGAGDACAIFRIE